MSEDQGCPKYKSQPNPTTTVYAPGKPRGDDADVKMIHGEGNSHGKQKACDVTQEEEELVDPQERLKECCDKECIKLRHVMEECNARVNSREQTAETCEMELYDFRHCVDHCVAAQLFHYLK